MSTIVTITGKQIDLMEPVADAIDILDIAHGLSMICRFAGQIPEFYSVAQHSVVVSRMVPQEYAMWGLLHDASEAYICDIPGPLKREEMLHGYRLVERQIMECVAWKFDLRPIVTPDRVYDADKIALATEFRDLRGVNDEQVQAWTGTQPALTRIVPLPPTDARREFMARYHEIRAAAGQPGTPVQR